MPAWRRHCAESAQPKPFKRKINRTNFFTDGCSASRSRSRVTVVSRPQRRRHGRAVLRRNRHSGTARHVAQRQPGNDVIGASARDADACRDP